MSKMGLTKHDDEKIGRAYSGGDHEFYHQDLSVANEEDAKRWLDSSEMVGLVSEVHGGIIGYIHQEHANDITTVLNLYAIDRLKDKTCTACGGSGYYDSHGSPLCGACDGTGENNA